MTPLEPDIDQKYPQLVRELHDALRPLLFPQLPDRPGRVELMAKLLGTGISQAMYLLDALHRSLPLEGDVCEFGVAQGATSALIAHEISDTTKRLWLYDSFRGLPKPSEQDVLKDDIFGLGAIENYEGQMACRRDEVEARLDEVRFPKERLRIKEGFVPDVFSRGDQPGAIAFAYLDFDFYEPVRYTLELLEHALAPGGRVMVDDYNFFSLGAKAAVDEFVASRLKRFEISFPHPFAGHFCTLRKKPRGFWFF